MTTIVASAQHGIMVADSKMVADTVWFPVEKIIRHKNELIGTAGDEEETAKWLDWYMAGKLGKEPKKFTEFEALILRPSGLYYLCANTHEIKVPRGFHGIGSGGAAAVVALLCGKHPRDAVRIACMVDQGSGGRISSVRLNDKKKGK
jgi:hypothetical protein